MKNAVNHWKYQRYSAILLFFISLWLCLSIICVSNFSYIEIIAWLKSPINSILMVFFFLVSFFHARLGLQVVLEDYIVNLTTRNRLLFMVNGLSWVLSLVALLCICVIFLNGDNL